jgi:hypothetical protein
MPQEQGSNRFNTKEVRGLLDRIFACHDELDQFKNAHMLNCKGPRQAIAEVMKEAGEAGHDMDAFRVYVKNRLSDRKCDRRIAELEPESRDEYDELERLLGDYGTTELGGAALKKAKKEETLNNLAAG